MPKKNPHAVALGTKGGQARTPKKIAAARKNAQKAGRKREYLIEDANGVLALQRRADNDAYAWERVTAFTPAMLIHVATWLRTNKPTVHVTAILEGQIAYRKA
jgi:hypothetical protein